MESWIFKSKTWYWICHPCHKHGSYQRNLFMVEITLSCRFSNPLLEPVSIMKRELSQEMPPPPPPPILSDNYLKTLKTSCLNLQPKQTMPVDSLAPLDDMASAGTVTDQSAAALAYTEPVLEAIRSGKYENLLYGVSITLIILLLKCVPEWQQIMPPVGKCSRLGKLVFRACFFLSLGLVCLILEPIINM